MQTLKITITELDPETGEISDVVNSEAVVIESAEQMERVLNAAMTPRQRDWYARGQRDYRSGTALLDFDGAPVKWTEAEVAEARAAYDAGVDAAFAGTEANWVAGGAL